jgi:hypothetical protein
MKLILYGASVTQQGGESGYSTHLIKSSHFTCTRQFGIGGCHFNDAGYYLLEEAINSEGFDVCVLDWNSTWLGTFDQFRLASVVNRLLSNNILPVFAILPTNLNVNVRQSEDLVTQFSRHHGIPCIDLRLGFDRHLMLRDDYHTNEIGARAIAESLEKFLCSLDVSSILASLVPLPLDAVDAPKITIYPLNKILKSGENLSVDIRRVNTNQPVDITIDMTIGPFSSFMGMSHDGVKVTTYQIWDMWCHYERRKMYQIITSHSYISIPSKLDLYIEPGIVDYSVCRRSNFSFAGEHELRINRVYSTNLSLNFY